MEIGNQCKLIYIWDEDAFLPGNTVSPELEKQQRAAVALARKEWINHGKKLQPKEGFIKSAEYDEK